MPDLFIAECGVTEERWQEEFGSVCRIKSSLGVRPRIALLQMKSIDPCTQQDRLWVADPKALQRIYQNSSYSYKKPEGSRITGALLLDRGIIWAEGSTSVTL